MNKTRELTVTNYLLNFNIHDFHMGKKYPRINVSVEEFSFTIEMLFKDVEKAFLENGSYEVLINCGQSKEFGIINNASIEKLYKNIQKILSVMD